MKKSIVLLVAAFMMTLNASAQFQKGKGYVGASLTGLDLHYNGADKFSLGAEAKAGYLFFDNLMGTAFSSYEHTGDKNTYDKLTVGVGGRYYIIQNGLYIGVNGKVVYTHQQVEDKMADPLTGEVITRKVKSHYTDVMPGIELGYAFFINRSVTIEPAIYYDQSFKKHGDYSTVGAKVGIGIYLFDD